MNLAKVTAARQITVPAEICKFLNIEPGNKLLFREKRNGEVVVTNASSLALDNAQKAFRGAAEKAGLKNDEDVMKLVREVRYGEKAGR